jgi:hypothetical protein
MSNPLDATQFTLESAERIARVVRAAELGSPQARPLTFDSVPQQPSKVFRICTFTGAWPIGDSKIVTFRNVTTTPNTASAVNLFFPIGTGQTSTMACAVAKDGTAWYLIDVPLQTATAVFIGTTSTGVIVTSTATGISVSSSATASYVTDIALSGSLNTSSCSITISKTLTTASRTFITGTATAVFIGATATTVQVRDTYTGTYLRIGY